MFKITTVTLKYYSWSLERYWGYTTPGISNPLRHFQEIETTLNSKFDPAVDTLASLQTLEAFQFAEELEEISGKASSEANLETMLKKVSVTSRNRLQRPNTSHAPPQTFYFLC